MDSEGNFIPPAHFNSERLRNSSDRVSSDRVSSNRIHRALTTRVREGYSYCIDSGSNTTVVNHKIENLRNLRNLTEPLITETATSAGNL